MIKVLSILLLTILYINISAQNNVGIGTLAPNPNAALEIQSTDKGLLIPRLTTVQRNTLGTGLANTENSMLVYDVNDSVFYYWKSTVWIPIPGTSTDNQILTIVGDSLQISNGNSVLFIDNDTTNEKIDSVTYLNDTLTIYEGDSAYKTEIIGGEWADADKIGNSGFIYAKQALNNGTADTVIISDNGSVGIGTSNPQKNIHIIQATGKPGILIEADVNNTDENFTPGITLYQDGKLVEGYLGYIHGTFTAINQPVFGAMGNSLITVANNFANNSLSIQTAINDTVATTISYNRNMGIGVNAPIEKLHTKGQIKSEFVGGTRSGVLLDPAISDLPKVSFRASDNTNRFEFLSKIDPFTQNDRFYLRSIVTGTDPTDTIITFNGGNGNTGIGTTNPAVKLDVVGDVSVGKHYDYVYTGGAVVNGTYGNKLYFSGVAHNSDNLYFSKYNVSGDVSELRLMLGDNEGTVNNDAFVIGSANSLPAPAGHPWLDYFRVQSNGFVSIGNIPTTYPKARLHVTTAGNNLSDYTALFVNSPGVAGGSGVVFTNTESATATGFKFHAENTGTFTYANDNLKLSSITLATGAVNQNNILNITGDGNVGIGVAPTQRLTVFNGTTTGTYTTTGWIHSSDARLKTNVQPIESAMEIVNKLDGVYYNWKYEEDEKRQIGFLAQEVQKVLPEVVVGEEGDIEKGETLGMAYQNIVPVLVEAIKEQQKEIEKLKAQESKEIQELKSELEDIKKLLLAK